MSVLLSLQQLLNAALLFFIPGPMVSLVRICISGKFRVLRLSRPERDGQNQQRINSQGKNMYPLRKYGGQDAYMRQGSLGVMGLVRATPITVVESSYHHDYYRSCDTFTSIKYLIQESRGFSAVLIEFNRNRL